MLLKLPSFESLSFLRFLKLPSMDELTSKYFEKFGENVEFLDISGLRIRKLPSFIFENLPKLKWLDLRLMLINIKHNHL